MSNSNDIVQRLRCYDTRCDLDIEDAVVEIDRLCAEVAALKAKADLLDDAQVQEQIASIIHAAMRFGRESETPKWQGGNSDAEYRAMLATAEVFAAIRQAKEAKP
jgi:hypothetical protein